MDLVFMADHGLHVTAVVTAVLSMSLPAANAHIRAHRTPGGTMKTDSGRVRTR